MEMRWLMLVGLGLLLGCSRGSELQRVTVSGKVSYQGRPVADGVIVFAPLQGTKGPGASAIIKAGNYKVVASGGVPVGSYRVEIQAFRAPSQKSFKLGPLQDLPIKESYLPEQYNTQSTLEVTVSEQTVQTRDFDLK